MLDIKHKYNLTFIDLKNDEEFNKINSIATSEAVLKYSIEVLPIIMKESKILILGYGNSAKALVDDFNHFSKELLVAVRKESVRKELDTKNVQNINLEDLKTVIEKYDIIINTIPSLIIYE